MDVLSHMAHSCDATHLVNHTLTPALKLYVDHTRASLLLWGSTHPGRVQGLGPETKSKGYFILGQQNSPDSRKKKTKKHLLLKFPGLQKHPGSHLRPQILTLLFLQQLEAIDDKA